MDQAISQPDVQSLALAEPTKHVRIRWIITPGAIGALIAAPLVSLAGYSALFGATAVVAFAAAIGVWKITSVR